MERGHARRRKGLGEQIRQVVLARDRLQGHPPPSDRFLKEEPADVNVLRPIATADCSLLPRDRCAIVLEDV